MIRSTALLLLPLCTLGAPVYASDLLEGRVQMTGSIVDSACAIRVGSNRQTIAFKPLAVSGLRNGDESPKQALAIYISDCIASGSHDKRDASQHFKLTFEGQPYGKYFAVQGAAKGIALQIHDDQGKLISPGMLLEHSLSSADSAMLNYSLTLVGNGRTLQAGDYRTTIKLTIQHF